MDHAGGASSTGHQATDTSGSAAVRYQITDVERSVDFYTGRLGFRLEQRVAAAFASVTRGPLRLILSGPGGKQIQIEDPDGNPIGLHEAPAGA